MNKRVSEYFVKKRYPLLAAIQEPIRFDTLTLLARKNMSYTEIMLDLGLDYDNDTISGKNRQSGYFAFHIRILKAQHLVEKSSRNGLYFITVKGLNVLNGAKIINEAEMFL